jgi:Tol biopolymer transport system component/DNA-binding winged helix-turn-helix (wHTH) protein
MSEEIRRRGASEGLRDSPAAAKETQNQETPRLYEFGPFRLDPDERKLWRGNEIVALTPKAFDTLYLLVRNSGRLLEKDDLIRMLWPDTFVEEGSLSNHIFLLRKALSEDPAFIETVPRRGYRFVGAVRQFPRVAATQSERAPELSPGVASIPAAQGRRPWRSRATLGTAAVALLASLAIAGWFYGRYYGHSARSKTGQPSVNPAVTNLGHKYSPSLSPDGQQLAFTWNGGSGSHFSIYVKLIGTEDSLRLTKQASEDFNPVWSPDGRYIAFCRIQKGETGIYIIPAIGGAERRVREAHWEEQDFDDVLWLAGRLSWSPDGKLLAFSDRASGNQQSSIFLLSLDSLEVRRLTSSSRATGDYNPAFSPDGRTLAFNKGLSIYTVPVSGGEEHYLSSGAQYGWGLAWTPDGRDIVFAKAGWLANAGWLWKISARGGEPERLQFGQGGVEPSIRGNRLVYARQELNLNIWRRKLNSSLSAGPADRFISSTTMESGPQFSPDGSRIAFESTRSGAYEIWVCRSDGSNLIQLTHYDSVSGTPRWSPNGQQIVFDSRVSGNTGVFVVDSQGGSPRRLSSGPSSEEVPSWSRDGRWIYFASNRSGGWEVWKMPSAGGSAVQVTRHGGFAAMESPDGRVLYYAKGITVPGLWRVPTDGGEESELISSLEPGYWGYWAAVENGIYFLDTTGKPGIAFFNLSTHRTTRVFDLENRPAREAPGLAVSSDQGTILYTQVDALSRDIFLVENFR